MYAAPPVRPPFHLGAGWCDAWTAAYLADADAGRVVAGVPMLRDAARLGPLRYTRLRARTNLHTAAFDMTPDVQPTALAAALAAEPADLIEFDYVPEDARLLAAARDWPATTIAPHARVPVTDCRRPFADWLATRSRRDRQRLPRLERRLEAETPLRFSIETGGDGLDTLLGALFALEGAGWKGDAGTAIRDSAADTLFYTRLAHAAVAAGALRIALLHDGPAIAAFEYAILSGDRLFVLKAAYDEAFADRSIGHVLAMQHIRAACADDAVACYDVLANGMTPASHKLRFADRVETLYRIRRYGRGPRAQALRVAFAARRAAKALRDRRRG